MTQSLKELKEKLQSMGVPTDTPGLKGHDRREELANRLEEALLTKSAPISPKSEMPVNISKTNFSVPDLANLSMAEIRSRLTMLGESTSTPGLSGSERREELIKRLMESICGNDGGDDESGKDIMNKTFEQRLDEEICKPDPGPIPSPIGRQDINISPISSPSLIKPVQYASGSKLTTQEDIDNDNMKKLEQTRNLERRKMSELGEAKKRVAAIKNKRSVMISARFSGPMQDERLREVAKRLSNVESEALRVQSLIAKETKKHPPGGGHVVAKASSELVHDGRQMELDKLKQKLDDIRGNIKEKIKWHKTRIRCEEENNVEYGVEAENTEQNVVQEIHFEISKIKREIDIEQARVGKGAVARWDLRQKEINSKREEEEMHEQRLRDQVPPSITGHDNDDMTHAFHDDEDVAVSFPSHGMAGGEMFGLDTDVDELDSQCKALLSGGENDSDNIDQTHHYSQGTSDDDDKHEIEFSPIELKQITPIPPKSLVTEPNRNNPQGNDASKDKSVSSRIEKTASDMDLDSFISKMIPKSNALSTDDDVLQRKLAMLRQRSGLTEADRSAPPSKEDISKISPNLKAQKKSSSQKTVLTSAPKPIVHKKSVNEEKSKQDKKSRKVESYRGEAEITRMLSMNDNDLLEKTKELEKQIKSIAAEKTTNTSSSTDVFTQRKAAKGLSHEQEVQDELHEATTIKSTAAPSIVSPFDPKKVDKMYKNKNRPPSYRQLDESTFNQRNENAKEGYQTKKQAKDPWQKSPESTDSDNDDSEQESHDRSSSSTKGIKITEERSLLDGSQKYENKVGGESNDITHDIIKGQNDCAYGGKSPDRHSKVDDCHFSEQQKVETEVKRLRMQAAEYENAGRFDDVEETLLKALELNPMDMRCLDTLATFLHRKRGELGRAEAFYRRAIQVCVPSLMDELQSPRGGDEGELDGVNISWRDILDRTMHFPSRAPNTPPRGSDAMGKDLSLNTENSNESIGTTQLTRVHVITHVLLHYATFLRRAKGDIEVAGIVLRKAAEISPTDAVVLGTCAHHLIEDHISPENIRDATDMFKRALKSDPGNINNFLWYAKMLHKTGKLAEAELMFKVAMQKTRGLGKMGAAATCNYAMFLYKYRNKIESADMMFRDGLDKHPRHKGLMKSYKAMLRDMKSKKLKEMPPPPSCEHHERPYDENYKDDSEDKKVKSSKKKKKRAKEKKNHSCTQEEVVGNDNHLKNCSDDQLSDCVDDAHEDVDPNKENIDSSSEARNDDRKDVTGECENISGNNGSNELINDSDESPADSIDISDDHVAGDYKSSNRTKVDRDDNDGAEVGTEEDAHTSPVISSARSDSRGSSRGSNKGGLKARLYERVNSAGCRDELLKVDHLEGKIHVGDEDESKIESTDSGNDEMTEANSTLRNDLVKDNDELIGSSDSNSNEPGSTVDSDEESLHNRSDSPIHNDLAGITTETVEIFDDDNRRAMELENDGCVNDHESENDALAINTSFGTDDGVLSYDPRDEETVSDSFTQDLEKRGVITPHNTVPKETEVINLSAKSDSADAVEISFIDITCYDIYMFHLRSKHGDEIESDSQNRISLYWSVKVYPDTYWENETATQRVSDEKNSAIWRFPPDNDDSFSIKKELHLCFLLFEATNDTLLGSAIFPAQDIVNAKQTRDDNVFEIDDEIICEDGVTVIGQLQANVKFV